MVEISGLNTARRRGQERAHYAAILRGAGKLEDLGPFAQIVVSDTTRAQVSEERRLKDQKLQAGDSVVQIYNPKLGECVVTEVSATGSDVRISRNGRDLKWFKSHVLRLISCPKP